MTSFDELLKQSQETQSKTLLDITRDDVIDLMSQCLQQHCENQDTCALIGQIFLALKRLGLQNELMQTCFKSKKLLNLALKVVFDLEVGRDLRMFERSNQRVIFGNSKLQITITQNSVVVKDEFSDQDYSFYLMDGIVDIFGNS